MSQSQTATVSRTPLTTPPPPPLKPALHYSKKTVQPSPTEHQGAHTMLLAFRTVQFRWTAGWMNTNMGKTIKIQTNGTACITAGNTVNVNVIQGARATQPHCLYCNRNTLQEVIAIHHFNLYYTRNAVQEVKGTRHFCLC